MKKYRQFILPLFFLLALAAWKGRSYIRNLFPHPMRFAAAELVTVDDKRRISIGELKGKVVIVSGFQTWCGPCAGETPGLNELAARLDSTTFKVVYVTDEEERKISVFRSRVASGNILFVQSAARLSALGINVFPTTFLLDKKGNTVKTKMDAYDWPKEEATIRRLMAE